MEVSVLEVKVYLFTSVKGCLLSRGLLKVMEILTIWPKWCLPDLSFAMTSTPPLTPTLFSGNQSLSPAHVKGGSNFFHLPLNYKHVYISL